jgi:hypothetical protein
LQIFELRAQDNVPGVLLKSIYTFLTPDQKFKRAIEYKTSKHAHRHAQINAMKRVHSCDKDDQEVDPNAQPKVVYRIKADAEAKHTVEILDIHDILKEEAVLLQTLNSTQARRQVMGGGGLRCAHQHHMTYAHHSKTPYFKHNPSKHESIARNVNACTCLQKGDKDMNSTIHLQAQRALMDRINNTGEGEEDPIIFRAWKDCKQAMCSIDVQTITPRGSDATMETRGGMNEITGKMMQFDIFVRTTDKETGNFDTLAIEVYNTHSTNPQDREGVKYVEVCAQEILNWRDSGYKRAIVLKHTNIDTHCQRCEELAQRRAEQQAQLEEEQRIRLAEEMKKAEEQEAHLEEERRIRRAEEIKKKAAKEKKLDQEQRQREATRNEQERQNELALQDMRLKASKLKVAKRKEQEMQKQIDDSNREELKKLEMVEYSDACRRLEKQNKEYEQMCIDYKVFDSKMTPEERRAFWRVV